jgi:pimeloyl-ACP methyl ester carboxylesterase
VEAGVGRVRSEKPPKVGHFRSAEGRARFERAYAAALATWPTAPSPLDVPTRFGPTHVNACGAAAGTPIVLLHGLFMTSTSWAPNVAALGERHPVFAVDTICDAGLSVQERAVGGGVDLAAWLDDVLAGLDLARAHLVGLSYGSWLALNQALRAPERVASVTAIEPPGVITRGKVSILCEMVRAGVVRSDRALERLTGILGGGTPLPEPLLDVLAGAFRDFKVVQPFAELLKDDQLRSITTAMLLVFGARSPMSNGQRALDRASRLVPNLRAELVAGAAHTPTLEQPDVLNRMILDFVEGVDGNPARS